MQLELVKLLSKKVQKWVVFDEFVEYPGSNISNNIMKERMNVLNDIMTELKKIDMM